MAKVQIGLKLDVEMVARIDDNLGDLTRTAWIERAIIRALSPEETQPDLAPASMLSAPKAERIEAARAILAKATPRKVAGIRGFSALGGEALKYDSKARVK